jgi:hypothetical protein
MFLVQFEATPRRDAAAPPDAAGAFVSCWIERQTREEAIEVARAAIEAEGWIVGEPDEAYSVDADTYPPGKDGREYFEQALIDKEVLVYHCYPAEDEEESAGE